MTLVARPRPFTVATILHGPGDHAAVRALITSIAPDQSVTFVVVEDDRDESFDVTGYRSDLLGQSALASEVLEHSGRVEPNRVYFVPGSRLEGWHDGAMQLRAPGTVASELQWDRYYTAVSGDVGARAALIVFAGGREHPAAASQVLQIVADGGGLALRQEQEGGAFERIIRSQERRDSIITSVPLAELSSVVLEHAEPLLAEARPRQTTELYAQIEAILPDLCEALLRVTGHDFRHYKSSTLVRRTLRRIHLLRVPSAADYLSRIRQDATETRALFGDLLISVTSFFRDIEAFRSLASNAIPKMFEGRRPEAPLRIWVAGCATGEEAYSIAMLVKEFADGREGMPPVQIFATDLDEEALAFARRGVYPSSRLAHVSPERLGRFFTRSGQQYQVTKALREMVLFSLHNLTNDPPFSNIDLISCRNLLIYLGDELHHRLVPLFHYALAPGGFLFLGPSESLNTHQDLFELFDAKHRISRRMESHKRSTPWPIGRAGPISAARLPISSLPSDAEVFRALQATLATEFLPPAAVVTEDGEIVAASGNLDPYFAVSSGPFVNNVTRLVRDGLRVAVRAALRESASLGRRVVHDGGTVRDDEGTHRVLVSVQPFGAPTTHGALYLVTFQAAGLLISANTSVGLPNAATANALIERLELDLASTRDELHRTVQDLEAANEELKSSNEELLSMNEELQSANEELESSKEELQVANEALSEANSDLENLLHSTGIPTLFLDEDGDVRRVTPAAGRVFNLRPGDVGRPLSHFTHLAHTMPALPPIEEVYGAERAIEHEVLMRDGTWYLRRVLPYRTPAGEHEGIVVTFLDITERVLASQDFARSQSRFRQLAESIPQLAWMAHPDGHIFWYNQRWFDYTGTTPKEMEGWGWQSVHDAEVLPSVMERWRTSLSKGEPFDMTFPLRGGDGVYRPFLTRVSPFRDESGEITLWFGTNTDVSEEFARNEAVRRSQRELRTLADNTPDVLTRFDRNYRHVFVNAAAERVSGIPLREFIGRTNRELGMEPSLCDLWEGAIARVFEEGEAQVVDFAFQSPDGLRYFSARLVPEFGADGAVESALGVTRDRTAEHLIDEALQESNRRKDEFLATLAHELRNPLAPVRNSLELLSLTLPANDTTSAARAMMARQVDHMTRLIDDLMDISRINLGKVELRRRPVPLRDVVVNACETVETLVRQARQELDVRLPAEDVVLNVDPTRLAQVIGNLLHNASKYTPSGGRIELEASVVSESVVIAVRDTGIGIPAPMLERIFEIFTQVERADGRGKGGLGIGLALVRRLVQLHGGDVRASSDGEGKGSEFVIRMPLSAESEALTTPPIVPEAGTTTSLRILVVDDNADAADSMALLLESMGHRVRVAFNGAEAFDRLGEEAVDLAFVDIGLPDTNGYEIARWIREQDALEGVVLVALTGWGSAEHRRQSLEAGFDFHLTKPADRLHLKRILDRAPAGVEGR